MCLHRFTDSYTCDCDDGWQNVGAANTPCTVRGCLSGLVCENGGICVPGSGVTPDHCDCLPGFLGDECACEYIANDFVLSSAFGKNVYNFVPRAYFMFTDK